MALVTYGWIQKTTQEKKINQGVVSNVIYKFETVCPNAC